MDKDSLASLWGGVITEITMSLTDKSLSFQVVVRDEVSEQRQHIRCIGVTDFTLSNEDADTWDYVELTEVHIQEWEADAVGLMLELWSGWGRISITCDRITSVPQS